MEMNRRLVFHMTNKAVLAYLALTAAITQTFREMPYSDNEMHMVGVKGFLFIFVLVAVSFFVETYKYHQSLLNRRMIVRILLALAFSFIILSIIYNSLPSFMFATEVIAIALLVFGVLQLISHTSYWVLRKTKGFTTRILILGTGQLAGQIGKIIPKTDGNYVLSGYVGCPDEQIDVPNETILATRGKLLETVRREKADKIVISLSERRGVLPLQEIMNCKLNGVEVLDAPSFYEQMTGKLLLESITPSWFIFSGGFRVSTLYRGIKRITDVACSAAGLLLTLPFLPLIALLIRFDSRGPVFFRQIRVGEQGKNFTLYKFRTMREDAECGTGAVWAQEKDPRITRIGAFLRKSRIDEIPQLFNVLRGDMSLVGPRPERPEFVEKLKNVLPYYSERHVVKPGVSGWAQVRYPYGASVEDALEKLRYDLYYIKNLSLALDLMIILETIKVVLYRRGSR